MKKISTYLIFVFILSIITSSRVISQASCPDIVVSSFRIISDPVNPCLKKVSVNFINPTGGAKSIGVKITCGTSPVLTECHDASGQKDVSRNLTTAQFSCCNITEMVIEIAAYTGNSTCLGTPCITKLSIAGAPLPVYYKSFDASRKGSSVDLKWVTATEENNHGFEIEKQTGNDDWENIGFIASQAPNGNSSTDISYTYSDVNNTTMITNYRLKQIDIDGKIKYSPVRAVQGNSNKVAQLTLYPNPSTNGKVTIVFKEASSMYDVSLLDMNGRLLKQWNSIKGNSLDINNLTPGFYNLRVISKEKNEVITEKFVVSR